MDDHKESVLVIGATGQQGGAVARALLARGRTVHALVRDPDRAGARELQAAGARLVTGDLDDLASIRAALSGVGRVFLMLTSVTSGTVSLANVEAEVRRGTAVADLAAEAGVAHLVYSSVAGADQNTGIPHLESKGLIETHIRKLGLPATVLRPVFFMENFTTVTRPVLADGGLIVALALRPTSQLPLISIPDIGEFAALAFEQPETFVGQTLVIAGDRLSAAEMAERFGEAAGIPARFHQTPIEQLRAFDEEVAKMFDWFDSGEMENPDLPALRALYPQVRTLAEWLRSTGWRP
ncbi:NmrA/HSCARG family protein [Frankia sp. AgB1.9]|uniref:NmrA/HSCARG family protein n=1 Tax=unclassified Frankia TaxID=2632575 RepID=UPI00193470C3|nr:MULTISPECIES: NmrA/HSCARG family protein [unclassified Frankia]MBL7489967.1 NmrA/HSCARG family protein [Frankia sp. AgW1.1]MBL7552145.1 NmrA/HSCARG family protein [Frankia sp. AgB1.9]MBL7625258.1 NmrA/HSCARG family protein [Frankia sp. AgB1.8]